MIAKLYRSFWAAKESSDVDENHLCQVQVPTKEPISPSFEEDKNELSQDQVPTEETSSNEDENENWALLPNEVKMMIVKKLGKSSRLALRLCSKQDQQLVDAVPFRTIHKLGFYAEMNLWHYEIKKTMYSAVVYTPCESIESLQEKVLEIISGVDYINEMVVVETLTSKPLKFSNSSELIKIGKLHLESPNLASILKTVDPFDLKKLKLLCDKIPASLFNIPQVRQAEQLEAGKSFIRDSQLSKLEARILKLDFSHKLTSPGVNKYITKCALNLNEKKINFNIDYPKKEGSDEEVFENPDVLKMPLSDRTALAVSTKSSDFGILMSSKENHIGGFAIFQGGVERYPTSNSFNILETVKLFKSKDEFSFFTIGKTFPFKCSGFATADELQEALFETFSHIHYIKHLIVTDSSRRWKFTRSIEKQITVGQLTMENYSYGIDLLSQIEPVHLKIVESQGFSVDKRIYDMPQMINAEKLKVDNGQITDKQFLNLRAVEMNLDTREVVSEKGFNLFLKKCLRNLNKYDYNISTQINWYDFNPMEKFSGLKVRRSNKGPQIFGTVDNIVDSTFPEYQLSVTVSPNRLLVKRIMRPKNTEN